MVTILYELLKSIRISNNINNFGILTSLTKASILVDI